MAEICAQPDHAVICVLGMHRSGTSLITRVLNLLGMELGPAEHLMKPSAFNPKGFWEHQSIVDLDDEILKRLGGCWQDPPALVPGWEKSSQFGDLRQQARAIIQNDFGGAACWGWKDPRTCLTLPFWKLLLPPLRYVVCLRNPVDVARSLAHAMPAAKAMDLWHRYTEAALAHSAGQSPIFLFYEDFMEDWRRQMQRLYRFMGNVHPVPDCICTAVRDAIALELQHHRTSLIDVADEAKMVFPTRALYLALRLLVRRPAESAQNLQDPELERAVRIFSGYSLEAHETQKELQSQIEQQRARASTLETTERELANRDAALVDANAELHRIRAQVAEQAAALDRQRLELAEQAVRAAELSARVDELGPVQALLEDLQRSFQEQVREQVDRLRADLITRDAELFTGRTRLPAGRNGSPAPASRPSTNGSLDGGRGDRSYRELIERLRHWIAGLVPANAPVAVVSKGDPELVQLEGRHGWHFPQQPDGTYSGFHPKDSAAAIHELNRIRAKGAEFLLFPATALWWLEHYRDFAAHLDNHYRVVARDQQIGVLFGLADGPTSVPPAESGKSLSVSHLVRQLRGLVDSLLPADAGVAVITAGDPALLDLGGRVTWPFPADGNGTAAGRAPADSAAAIEQVNQLRQKGAAFLIVPKTADRWLDRYPQLGPYLKGNFRAVVHQRHVGTIFNLNGR